MLAAGSPVCSPTFYFSLRTEPIEAGSISKVKGCD